MTPQQTTRAEDTWISETFDPSFRPTLKANRILLDTHTDYQHVLIFENDHFGRVLMLDGIYQLTTADEFIYHEMMAHVPLMAHPQPRSVLVIGGGDGGVLREVLRHPSVEQATLCEIDPDVIDACRTYFPEINAGSYDDDRTTLQIADASKFLAETDQRFDAIIIDTSEPVGPNEVIFQENLISDCARVLEDGGVMVIQTGISFVSQEHISRTSALLKAQFAHSTVFSATVPTYAGGAITMGFATEDPSLIAVSEQTLAQRMAERGISETGYYTPGMHKAAFVLPPYIARML